MKQVAKMPANAQTSPNLRPARGYCGIGIYNVKNAVNVGGLWRHAQAFGASFVFTVGKRYQKEASDTTKAYRHLPMWQYKDADDFLTHRPRDCRLIGVEIDDCSTPLEAFVHPERAIYLLGAEDHGIPSWLLEKCQAVVEIPTRFCLNVASTGAVVLYDRTVKATSHNYRR